MSVPQVTHLRLRDLFIILNDFKFAEKQPINDGKRLRKNLTFLQGESMRQLFVVEHLAVSKSSLAIQISWKYSFCGLNNQYKK